MNKRKANKMDYEVYVNKFALQNIWMIRLRREKQAILPVRTFCGKKRINLVVVLFFWQAVSDHYVLGADTSLLYCHVKLLLFYDKCSISLVHPYHSFWIQNAPRLQLSRSAFKPAFLWFHATLRGRTPWTWQVTDTSFLSIHFLWNLHCKMTIPCPPPAKWLVKSVHVNFWACTHKCVHAG